MDTHPLIERVRNGESPYTYLNVQSGSISSQIKNCIEQEHAKNDAFPRDFLMAISAATWSRIVCDTQDETSMAALVEFNYDDESRARGVVAQVAGIQIISDYKIVKMGGEPVFDFNIAFYPKEDPTIGVE